MWSDKEFEDLENSEFQMTRQKLILMYTLVNKTKENIEKELLQFYQQYGIDGVVTYNEARKWVSSQDKRRRLTVLLLFLAGAFVKLNSLLQIEFLDLETKIFRSEFEFFNVDIPNDFSLIQWGQDNLSWKERLGHNTNIWYSYVGVEIKRAIMRGDSIDIILEGLNIRFDSIENALYRLGLTESSALTALARKEIFKQLGIKKFRYYAKEDERTCDICGSMHGLVFPISSYEVGVNAPCLHPNCRCWTVPAE